MTVHRLESTNAQNWLTETRVEKYSIVKYSIGSQMKHFYDSYLYEGVQRTKRIQNSYGSRSKPRERPTRKRF